MVGWQFSFTAIFICTHNSIWFFFFNQKANQELGKAIKICREKFPLSETRFDSSVDFTKLEKIDKCHLYCILSAQKVVWHLHLFYLHMKTLYFATYSEQLNCFSTNKSFDRLWMAFWMLIHSSIQQMTNWQPKSKHGAAVQFIAKTNVNLRLRCKNVSKMYWKQRRSLKHLGCRSWYFRVEECWFNERCWIKMCGTGLFCLCYKQSDSFFFFSYQSPFSRTFQTRHIQWLKKKSRIWSVSKGR